MNMSPAGSTAVGADAGEEVVGGFGEEAVGNGDRGRGGAWKAKRTAADTAVEMHVHVVAGVMMWRGTGFIFRRACAVVNDVHQPFIDEEREGTGDGRAVDGVECLFYLK